MVTATYTLDATKPTDVQLFYSPDKTEPRQWLPATIFPQKTAGTHTDYWNCDDTNAKHGQFFFKLEAVVEISCRQSTTIDLAMIAVEGGEFIQGAQVQNSTEGGYGGAYPNARQVTLSNFCISETPVTQAQFEAVMGANPSNFKGYADSPDRPVERVCWYDAIIFCNKLSLMEGKTPVYSVGGVEIDWENIPYDPVPGSVSELGMTMMNMSANGYRLPTVAEWEYAARGGQESETAQGNPPDFYYSGGNTANLVAWYNGNSGSQTHIVKDKLPNALGLYDMCGNVSEWCWDWACDYTDIPEENPTGSPGPQCSPDALPNFSRKVHGGGWGYFALSVRDVDAYNDNKRLIIIGFRIVCRCWD